MYQVNLKGFLKKEHYETIAPFLLHKKGVTYTLHILFNKKEKKHIDT